MIAVDMRTVIVLLVGVALGLYVVPRFTGLGA